MCREITQTVLYIYFQHMVFCS